MKNAHRSALSRFIRWNNISLPTRQPDIQLLTGLAATAAALLIISEFLIKLLMGSRPGLDQSEALIAYMVQNTTPTIVVIIIDTTLMACLIIFFACFRQLIVRARHDLNWLVDIAFGASLVFVAVTLVGDSMDAGTVLDTVRLTPDASVIRALTEGHMLLFGTIGCVLTSLITAIFAYATFASGAVPKWTGWIAYVVALLNILAIPTAFGGTSATSFFSAGGAGVALFAIFPFLAWVIAVGIVTFGSKYNTPISHF
ncbi:MAG: hypothetical protein JWO99_257 [Candidatus Saccharibacteria bacterium]|nr:hypothetical protein [Candidatus Saccharibacteria bacterium]